MTTIELESINQLIKDIESHINYSDERMSNLLHKNWMPVYRGQSCNWELLPSLFRSYSSIDILAHEKNLLCDFKRKTRPLIDHEPKNELEWLALAQHHGLPTRLLDWTENALVAAYFAVEDETIWDKDGEIITYWAENCDFIEKEDSVYSFTKTTYYMPSAITKRITAQQGIFSIHAFDLMNNRVIKIEENEYFKKYSRRYVIKSNDKEKFKIVLDKIGVNSYSVFPDLDGLSRYLKWKDKNEKS